MAEEFKSQLVSRLGNLVGVEDPALYSILLDIHDTIKTIANELYASTNVVTVSTHFPLQLVNSMLIADASLSAVTVTLPDATTCKNKVYTVHCSDSTNTVQLASVSGQTIDYAASPYGPLAQGDTVKVMSDGSNWIIV